MRKSDTKRTITRRTKGSLLIKRSFQSGAPHQEVALSFLASQLTQIIIEQSPYSHLMQSPIKQGLSLELQRKGGILSMKLLRLYD